VADRCLQQNRTIQGGVNSGTDLQRAEQKLSNNPAWMKETQPKPAGDYLLLHASLKNVGN
jgi:hypothetical protein